MSKNLIDFEAIIPFQVLAILIWPAGLVNGWKSAVLFTVVTLVIAQFMIMTRAFSRDRENKVRYFVANNIYALATIAGVYVLQIYLF